MPRRPPFASGKVAGDYEPLFLYWEVARERGREDLIEAATLREEDYKVLQREAGEGLGLDALLEALTSYMEDRVDPVVAAEAYRRYGVEASPEDARRLIARLLASWLVEAGEYWGFVRLRRGEG